MKRRVVISLALAVAAFGQTPPAQTPAAPAATPPAGRGGRGGGAPQPMPPGPPPNSQYRLGPDSLPQEGVPKGEIRGPFVVKSEVYPGTQHTYWVYVPQQYDPAIPAALMVFQDGQAFKDENGDLRTQNVMDNLIYRREIPVMLGVLVGAFTGSKLLTRMDPKVLKYIFCVAITFVAAEMIFNGYNHKF